MRGNRTTFCSLRATNRDCSRPSSIRSSTTAPPSPTARNWITATARIIRRSVWVTSADGADFPHADRIARIRRDDYDLDGTLISKEVVHAATSLTDDRASDADLARIARGQRGIESVHWLRHRLRGGSGHRLRR